MLEYDTIETKLSKHKQQVRAGYKKLIDKRVAKTGKFAGDCAEKGYTYCVRNTSKEKVCPIYGKKGGCALYMVAAEFAMDGKKEAFLKKNPKAADYMNKAQKRKAAEELFVKTVLGEGEDGTN
jgi:hypothetical protein